MPVEGLVDALLRPIVPLVVRGPFGFERIEAIIDTGFSGALALPDTLVVRLGLRPLASTFAQFGDASVRAVATYVGELDWVEGRARCEVIGTQLDSPLLGRALLDGHRLTVDFGPPKEVEIR